MSTVSSSCATAPPLPIAGGGAPAQSPMQVPIQGGGAAGGVQSPVQAPVQGGGQSPMQVPMAPSAVQGASGGGQLVQPQPVAAAPAAAPAANPAPVAAPVPAAGAQPAAPVSGGGPIVPNALLPVLTQLSGVLTQLLATVKAGAQAQAGAGGVVGGGGGKHCAMPNCPHAGAQAVEGVQEMRGAAGAPTAAPAAPAGGGGKIDSPDVKAKGTPLNDEQRRLAEIVLKKGQSMGASEKVLKAAIATMITESVIKNDASVDSKDHDSLGLFQQRPSQGWGTREQISDPEYAAMKFFEKAIAKDKQDPGIGMGALAQSVQRSAYPDRYDEYAGEASAILADYLG